MRNKQFWVVSFAFAFGCGSASNELSTGAGGGASSGGARAAGGFTQTGGFTQSGGSAGSPASAGGGGEPPHAAGNAGASMSGGSGGGPGSAGRGNSGGGAGRGGGGASSGGAASSAGNGGGGAPVTAGAGGCTPNLACKLQAATSSGDLHQDCVDRINQFRTQCACLPPLARSTDGEACADQMAEYDAGKNTAHAGYTDKICKPLGAQNECPGYSSNNQVISLCMQQMWDEGQPPQEPCDGQCFEDHGHFINMTTTTSTKVACGFYTTASGKVWAVQNFLR